MIGGSLEKEGQPASSYISMFEGFREELDEHHDRRERNIKASRDITAASKKIIFTLQRVRAVGQSVPAFVTKGNAQYWETIEKSYRQVAGDTRGINAHRYMWNVTGGNQEFIEAFSFQHYLETQTLVSYQEARSKIAAMSGETGAVMLTPDDYLLGIFDMVGELMRFSITAMATNGSMPTGKLDTTSRTGASTDSEMDVDSALPQAAGSQAPRSVLTDLRDLRLRLEMFEPSGDWKMEQDVRKKAEVMRECVDKVEKAWYGLTVRGEERPKGWLPDVREDRKTEVESY